MVGGCRYALVRGGVQRRSPSPPPGRVPRRPRPQHGLPSVSSDGWDTSPVRLRIRIARAHHDDLRIPRNVAQARRGRQIGSATMRRSSPPSQLADYLGVFACSRGVMNDKGSPGSVRDLLSGRDPIARSSGSDRPHAGRRSVAVALVSSGEVATIALEECNRRAAGLGPQNRAVQFSQNRASTRSSFRGRAGLVE
jgi:hypothetical protein